MGACGISIVLDGKLDRKGVQKAIDTQRGYDGDRNGHQEGYSGDWQTIHGVSFPNLSFNTYEQASEYCSEHCEKRGGLAVKFKHLPQQMITDNKKLQSIKNNIEKQNTIISDLIRQENVEFKESKVEFCTCGKCKSKLNKSFIRNSWQGYKCPVCNERLMSKASITKIEKAKAKIEELQTSFEETKAEFIAKKSKEERWFVYGLAAC